MRVIAVEEHYRCKEVVAAIGNEYNFFRPLESAGGEVTQVFAKIDDLGEGRLAEMDAAGIDMQVISHSFPSPEWLEASQAVPLAQRANDVAAEAVGRHPKRFAAFAILPVSSPAAAAQELERTVTQLHFKGALINGATQGRFLDDPSFSPLLERAEALRVPLYIHPGPPARPVWEAYYSGLPTGLALMLSTAGWGWHAEQGLHLLRMIATGVFDRFPGLQVLIGHVGEMIPFLLARADRILTPLAKGLHCSVADYVHKNVHITISGMFTLPPLLLALQVLGADRILFSVDYPFGSCQEGRKFLENLPL